MSVDVSPTVLRETAQELIKLRQEDLIGTRPQVQFLHGPPQAAFDLGFNNDYDGAVREISTGGFVGGAYAQQYLGELYLQALETFNSVYQDVLALTSALYILADLFEIAEHDQALLFAFLEAEPPGWLPPHIDPDSNTREDRLQLAEDQQARDALFGQGFPDEWEVVETVEYLPPGTPDYRQIVTTIVVKDEDGKVRARHVTRSYAGSGLTTETTTLYDNNGDPSRQEVRQERTDGSVTNTTYEVVGDGGLEETERVEYTPLDYGGSRTQTYTTQWEEGKRVRDEDGNLVLVSTHAEVHEVTLAAAQYDHRSGEVAPAYQHSYYTEVYDPDDPEADPSRADGGVTIAPQRPASAPDELGTALGDEASRDAHFRAVLPAEEHEWYGVSPAPEPEPEPTRGGGGGGTALIE